MRRALYASGGVHAAIILWIAVGGDLFTPAPDTEFEVTGVTLMSVEEFESLTQTAAVAPPSIAEAPVAPEPSAEAEAPQVSVSEDAAPLQTPPAENPAPAPDPEPVAVPPVPDTVVTDEVAALPSPPLSDPDLPQASRPTPRDAPRVAPTPAPTPAPDADTAPEVVDSPTDDAVSETPTPETAPTAPEESTTEIVTEAEEPAASAAPEVSRRPPARPARPAPTDVAVDTPELEADPAPPPTEDAIADAVAAAVASATATDTAPVPAGPPLSASARDGFRVAVQRCWNVGALSSEALQTTVVVGFEMARDGTPDVGSIRLVDFSGGSRAAAQQAYEAARRAVIRCGANGYDLPAESYDRWAEVELVFNPDGMRLR